MPRPASPPDAALLIRWSRRLLDARHDLPEQNPCQVWTMVAFSRHDTCSENFWAVSYPKQE